MRSTRRAMRSNGVVRPRSGSQDGAAIRGSCRRLAAFFEEDTPRSSRGGQHLGGNQGDAAVAALEALGVEFRVFADHQPFRDMAAAIDDDLGQPRVAADLDLGKQHRLGEFGHRS